MNRLKDTVSKWKLNTSNLGKFEEFKALFSKQGCVLEATHIDLPEIEADYITVVQHKASQVVDRIVVDETSLEIEGEKIGINVRWLLNNLPKLKGKSAIWTVLLAYRLRDQILIFKGEVHGSIVSPRGKTGFGFDPFFLPEDAKATLAESKPDQFNARAKAVEALIKGDTFKVLPLMQEWNGSWQKAKLL